jgi:hypothetical protein
MLKVHTSRRRATSLLPAHAYDTSVFLMCEKYEATFGRYEIDELRYRLVRSSIPKTVATRRALVVDTLLMVNF